MISYTCYDREKARNRLIFSPFFSPRMIFVPNFSSALRLKCLLINASMRLTNRIDASETMLEIHWSTREIDKSERESLERTLFIVETISRSRRPFFHLSSCPYLSIPILRFVHRFVSSSTVRGKLRGWSERKTRARMERGGKLGGKTE